MKSKLSEKNITPNMDCINLLTSILICYPEISIISVEPEHEVVYLNYTLNKVLTENQMNACKDFLTDSLEAYQYLENLPAQTNEITLSVENNFTFINVRRDVKTFSHGEIRLITNIIKEKFSDCITTDFDYVPIVDNGISQSEMIDTMLGTIKINPVIEHMIGIRENGRVIVYNK